jgi:WD40 repeat protein
MSEFSHDLAILIGIDQYSSGIAPLQTAVNDVQELAQILEKDHGYQVAVLVNQQATLETLLRLINEALPKRIQPDSRLLFYFAGHGIALNGDDGPEGYLIPQDAKLGDTGTYLSMPKLQEALSALPCRHFLGVLDCCFAGAFRWSSTRDLLSVPEVIHKERYERFITDPAWQTITSAAYDQKALDSLEINSERGQTNGNHSPFAAALITALAGSADVYPPAQNGKPAGDGVITATELYLYLRDCVEVATEGNRQRQTPGIWPLKKHDKGEYIFLSPGHELNLPPAPPLDASKNPYRGLQSFEEDQSDLFFGRQELTEKLGQFVNDQPLTVVLGASGSGKSSLVKAGLVPFLKQQDAKNAQSQWQILAPIRPGETPFNALRNSLNMENMAGLTAATDMLSQYMAVWCQKYPQQKLLLPIDQFEELITLCQNEKERENFLQGLAQALKAYPEQLRLVITLRSDFEPQFQDAGLKDYWSTARFVVPPLTRVELREAIEEPASKRVMYFQSDDPKNPLVDQLIDEVAEMPGALPLLSFTLSELYLKYLRRQDDAKICGDTIDRAITEADYKDLGGVARSLTQRADQEYDALVQQDPAYAQTIRHVMLRMVAVGGGELARRRVPLSEFEYPPEQNERVKTVIQRFSVARLLVEGNDTDGKPNDTEDKPYVEPAHDALVRGWQKLLTWKQEQEEDLLLQRRLTPAAEEWKNSQNDAKKQPKGILSKADSAFDWLDVRLFSVEKEANKIFTNFISILRKSQNQQEKSKNKPEYFLWDTNPYLNVLSEEIKSDENWFNELEIEFIKASQFKRRRNISWRWRIAGAITLIISGAAIVAFLQWTNAQRQLVSTINSLVNNSEELFDSNKEFDALLAGLNAGKNLKQASGASSELQSKIKDVLQNAMVWVKEKNRLEGHSASVKSVSFSPDKSLLASGSADNTIRIWDVATGKTLHIFQGHTAPINSVSFSPDGQRLASGSTDNTIRIWDIDKEHTIRILQGHTAPINSVSFSPNGQRLASGSDDNTIRVWDAATGNIIHTIDRHRNDISSVSFSPDGRRLVSGSFDRKIGIWNTTTGEGKIYNTEENNIRMIDSVSFSPDNKTIAFAGEDQKIWLFNPDNKTIGNLTGHRGRIKSISFSQNGQRLVSAGWDNTIKLWDVTTLKEIDTLSGHRQFINSVSFSSDDQFLASASEDLSIKIWNIGDRLEANAFITSRHEVWSISFSSDGSMLASGNDDGTINILDVDKGEIIKVFEMKDRSRVRSISFNPQDRNVFASVSWNGQISLWNVNIDHPIKTINTSGDLPTSISFSPNGKLIAEGNLDGDIKLWNVANGRSISTLNGHNDSIQPNSIDFSPDGRWLASGSLDKTIKIWSVDTGNIVYDFTDHTDAVNGVSFSPDGNYLASASSDQTIKIWNVTSGTIIKTFRGHINAVKSVSFSPDGQRLASGGEDKTIIIWDVKTSEVVTILKGHKAGDIRVSFSPDGRLLASGDADKTVILWNWEILSKLTLENLLKRGCNWVRDYLENNPNVGEVDRHLCDGL